MNRLKGNIWNVAERALLEEDVGIESDAVDLIRDCVVEFLSSLSCDALSIAESTGKRRVQGHDIVNSLRAFGFDQYVPPLEVYLQKWHIHSNLCQECGKLFPIPTDVLQQEEIGKATPGKQKAKKSNVTVSSSSIQVSEGDGNVAANSSSAGNHTISTPALTTKGEEKETKGKKTKTTKDADGNQLPGSPATKPSKGGRQKVNANNVNNAQFLETLRSRMFETKNQPDMLKLLASELKVSQKTVKDMLEQMMADEEANKSGTENIQNVNTGSENNGEISISNEQGNEQNQQELSEDEMSVKNNNESDDEGEAQDLPAALNGEEKQLQEVATTENSELVENSSSMDVDC